MGMTSTHCMAALTVLNTLTILSCHPCLKARSFPICSAAPVQIAMLLPKQYRAVPMICMWD